MKNNAKGNSSSTSKKEDAKKEVISSVLSTKKFIGLDYEKLDAKKQKRFRSKIRRGLFAIISHYLQLKLSNKGVAPVQDAKESFESFKAYCKEHYSIPLSEIQNVFKGTGKSSDDFQNFLTDFRTYANGGKKEKTSTPAN